MLKMEFFQTKERIRFLMDETRMKLDLLWILYYNVINIKITLTYKFCFKLKYQQSYNVSIIKYGSILIMTIKVLISIWIFENNEIM